MKKILALSIIALLGLTFCGKKDDPDVVPEVVEPGSFGFTRVVWDSSATPQDRVELSLEVRDAEIELVGGEKATIETNKGTIILELYSKDAPGHVANFVKLSQSGYYDGLIWHRYVPGFVIQGGSPANNSVGGTPYTIPFEDSPRLHESGALGAARTPDPNSHSGQFYITLAPRPDLDGDYVVFGKVVEGMDVVMQLRVMDTMIRISVVPGVGQ